MMNLGAGKVPIMSRALGVVLDALAVQLVLDGVGGFYETAIRRSA